MLFKLKDPIELDAALEYIAELSGREATVEITQKRYKRSLQSNKYYHVMLQYFGTQAGLNTEEVKSLIRQLQTELYQVTYTTIGGVSIMKSRSSADFDSAEMAKSIDEFRKWAREVADVQIPAPDEERLLLYMQEIISRHQSYL